MKIFQALYEKAMLWSRHRHAPVYLGGLSFAESCVLPFPPPDVMLAPMSLAKPLLAWRFAFLTTVMSVLGGLFGYLIGVLFSAAIEPYILESTYKANYLLAQKAFIEYGPWAVFIAGFSPIPYKIFTISAGISGMALVPFIIASFVGRGARFFLVAGLMRWGGEKMEQKLKHYVDLIGWLLVIAVILALVIYKLFYAS